MLSTFFHSLTSNIILFLSTSKTLDTFSQPHIHHTLNKEKASFLNKSNFFNLQSFFICQLSDVCVSIVNVILTTAKLPNLQFCLCRLNFAYFIMAWLTGPWLHLLIYWVFMIKFCSTSASLNFALYLHLFSFSLSLFLSFCFNSIAILLFSTVSHSFILRLHLAFVGLSYFLGTTTLCIAPNLQV